MLLLQLYSKLEDDKEKSVEEQRKGLSLAPIFAKPRPMWIAPMFSAFFGDLFIQNSTVEVSYFVIILQSVSNLSSFFRVLQILHGHMKFLILQLKNF